MLSDDEIRDTARWAAQQAAAGRLPMARRVADIAGELLAVRTRAAALADVLEGEAQIAAGLAVPFADAMRRARAGPDGYDAARAARLVAEGWDAAGNYHEKVFTDLILMLEAAMRRIADIEADADAAVEFHRQRCSQPTDAEVVRVVLAVVYGAGGES